MFGGSSSHHAHRGCMVRVHGRPWLGLRHRLAKRAKRAVKDGPNSVQKHSDFVLELLACKKSASWQKACNLLVAMPTAKLQPEIRQFNVTIAACKKSQEWQQVLNLLHVMPQLKLEPDVISCNAALSSLGPRWQMAIHLLESCSSYRLQPDVISFNATMSSCEKAQQWQQALLVFEAIFKDTWLDG